MIAIKRKPSEKEVRRQQLLRRLLDLSKKNALLFFTEKNALRLIDADCDGLFSRLAEGVRLVPAQEKETEGALRVQADERALREKAGALFRRGKEAEEETGAGVLYVAFGMLKIPGREGEQRAPLVLAPVSMRRVKGESDYVVSRPEGECFFNATLLEYLRREYDVTFGALGGDLSALTVSEILSRVRIEADRREGWEVIDCAYLGAFSFQGFLLWNELHRHGRDFERNALVRALLTKGRFEQVFSPPPQEDESDPSEVLLPLPADSSQYSAVALAHAGASFVLHGPPGTGKSQTIANIIADALAQNKRVLFVAEKRAAIDVVKKRLEKIGVGEFCLQLHTDRTDRAGVLKEMEETLSLSAQAVPDFKETAARATALRDELKEAFSALHTRHGIGMSVYEAVISYLDNSSAPDLFALDSAFCEGLTGEKLSECRELIRTAAAAAKECGKAAQSAFCDIKKDVYSAELRDAIACASEALLSEAKHLRRAAGALAGFFRQHLGPLSFAGLETLAEIVKSLSAGACRDFFCGVDGEAFTAFFNASRRLDEGLAYYEKHFKKLVCCGQGGAALRAAVTAGGDIRTDRRLMLAAKKLGRVALHALADEDMPKYLKNLADILEARADVLACPLSKKFLTPDGRINYKKRAKVLAPLYRLHTACASLFPVFRADAFNAAASRAAGGCAEPLFEGFLSAYAAFTAALQGYLSATGAEREEEEGDVPERYASRAAAILDNLDLLPGWCSYRAAEKALEKRGLFSAAEALESGRLSTENVLAGFEKSLCKQFLEYRLSVDPALARLTAGTLEDTAEKLKGAYEELRLRACEYLRSRLISRLPKEEDGEWGALRAAFLQLAHAPLSGKKLRTLFSELKAFTARICPCLLMSPSTAAQYLPPEPNMFDLVVFDEASQLSTAEAVGCLARGRAAIVVGDVNQLPPPSFFRATAGEESENTESLLDDCLIMGLPERRLKWHYRSRHESLIAFSNAMYYANSLCTFPSPDASKSRVKLVKVGGMYMRGQTKCNRGETEALVAEIIRRLRDPVLSQKSMGVVTFSSAQQEDVERVLTAELIRCGLEGAAYEREEPLFIKNLENVQGDERDVILFSVCYGPDANGKLSLNFGPLNRAGGWRRLNVAVSRAREEMLVFSSITPSMINLSRTASRGVEGLKAFLEFAERGTPAPACRQSARDGGMGRHIASALSRCGYECELGVGASDFKVDVAVLDPKNCERFLLAVLFDRDAGFSVKDREILEVQALKSCGWQVTKLSSVRFYHNPGREIKRLKELLDRITGADSRAGEWLKKYSRPYRAVKSAGVRPGSFLTDGAHDGEIVARIRTIVSMEEPISRAFLKKRLCEVLGIARCGARESARLDELIDGSNLSHERAAGVEYFYKNPRAVTVWKFRAGGSASVRKGEEGYSAFEILALIKGVLEERVAVYADEVASVVETAFPEANMNSRFLSFLGDCISYGEERGLIARSVSDRITLA